MEQTETPTTPDVQGAVTGYARAVRQALAATGIGLADAYVIGAGDPPTIQIRTTHRRGDTADPQRYRAVVEWDGEHGWSAGWHENLAGGGTVHGRGWFDLHLIAFPALVADAVMDWLTFPERFADMPVSQAPRASALALLTDYGPGPAVAAEPEKGAPELAHTVETLHAELAQVHAMLADAELTVTRLRETARRETQRGDRRADRADDAARDRNLYGAQVRAVRDLCGALRAEGLPGIARRVEETLLGAEVAAAQQTHQVEEFRSGILPETMLSPVNPAFLDDCEPGYVVAECGHRVAQSEWRSGFKTCERCPSNDSDEEDEGEVSDRAPLAVAAPTEPGDVCQRADKQDGDDHR